jgi:ABC-2 type transport system ATP-binding protein
MNSSPAIAVDKLSFEYPGVKALSEVSFRIEPASVTALVGPNGAGKSTLLRCIAGLDRPLLGSIELAGVDVLEQPRLSHRRLGFLADFYGLYDALSVRRALTYMAAAHGVAERDIASTVERTAQRLEIDDLLERRCGELSRGQRQRVAIGQALVHAPPVLLLDEPAAGLDPEARHALARLFTRLRGEGMTLLVSSHILAELDEYSSHMLVLRAGRMIEHRALAGGAAEPVRRLRLGLASPVPDLAAVIAGLNGVRVLENADRDALLELTGNDHVQAEVLRMLVERGLPVTRFSEERENLHASYLRTVGTHGAAP